MKRVYLFKRYERLWHWAQVILVLTLVLTGFTLHGTLALAGFEKALNWHEVAGLTLIGLTLFTMFWHITTGEGKQFFPQKRGMAEQIRFYTVGIFRREPHPTIPTPEAKFNPLQRVAYLSLLVFIFPVQILTGFLMWGMSRWPVIATYTGGVRPLALIHTAGAFATVCFILMHLYMTTTGRTFFSNLHAMITGWAEEPDDNQPLH